MIGSMNLLLHKDFIEGCATGQLQWSLNNNLESNLAGQIAMAQALDRILLNKTFDFLLGLLRASDYDPRLSDIGSGSKYHHF
jgi:hypothetical protein